MYDLVRVQEIALDERHNSSVLIAFIRLFGKVFSSLKNFFLGVVIIELLIVKTFLDVVIKMIFVCSGGIDIALGHSSILDGFFVKTTEKNASGDILPVDIFYGYQVNTGFDQEFFNVGSFDIIHEILFEGIHEFIKTTFFLVPF